MTGIEGRDNIKKKSATVQQRFASVYSYLESNRYFGIVGGCFLMFSFLTGLHNTDHGYDSTDDRNYNTDNPNHCFCHLMYLSLDFPFVSPPIILEVLKMYSFWRKANRLPFW